MNVECVWQSFDQQTLDREYSAAGTVPAVEPYFERYAQESARVRGALLSSLDVPYGTTERQRLDAFAAPASGAPVLLYLHGGYWRRLSKDYFSFFVEPFVRAGAAAVVPNYSLAPGATLDQMVSEMREVIGWVQDNIASLNGDPLRVVLAGHSAGGQLAGMLAATDWAARGLPRSPMVGMCGMSGLYDLEPVQRSNVNEWLQLDEEGARRNSPILHLPTAPLSLVAAVGEKETNEFQRQTVDFTTAWCERGYAGECLVLTGLNHFDLVLDVLDDSSRLRAAILQLLGFTE